MQVVTCDAAVDVGVWRPMVLTAVNRSFNQITVTLVPTQQCLHLFIVHCWVIEFAVANGLVAHN